MNEKVVQNERKSRYADNPNQAAQAEACTLDVVLVAFDDATTPAGDYDYHEHDLPYE